MVLKIQIFVSTTLVVWVFFHHFIELGIIIQERKLDGILEFFWTFVV